MSLCRWLFSAGVAVLVAIAAFATPASADKRIASSGYYTEAGAGATFFLGDAADYSQTGLSVEVRTGYELTSWFGVGLFGSASTHEATVPPPPEGEYYQLYSVGAEARLGFLIGPIGLFADGGIGVGIMSSNVLSRVDVVDPDESLSLALRAGAGLEYQLRNRHYAIGLAGQWMSLPGFADTQGVATRLYLRYTY
ncbi:MAG: outer membrane beta-barrel protein [Myxococcota bacterium]